MQGKLLRLRSPTNLPSWLEMRIAAASQPLQRMTAGGVTAPETVLLQTEHTAQQAQMADIADGTAPAMARYARVARQ